MSTGPQPAEIDKGDEAICRSQSYFPFAGRIDKATDFMFETVIILRDLRDDRFHRTVLEFGRPAFACVNSHGWQIEIGHRASGRSMFDSGVNDTACSTGISPRRTLAKLSRT